MNSYQMCGRTIVLPPHASRSDACGKPAGHDDDPAEGRVRDDVHKGDRRGIEWYVDSDGAVLCGAAAPDADGPFCCGLEIPCPTHTEGERE